MIKKNSRLESRKKRKLRIRANISGTLLKPRLSIFKSNQHIYAQVINDDLGNTIFSASSIDKEFDKETNKKSGKEIAYEVGCLLASRAKKHGVNNIIFDRNGFLFHGRVKSLADGARENGLVF